MSSSKATKGVPDGSKTLAALGGAEKILAAAGLDSQLLLNGEPIQVIPRLEGLDAKPIRTILGAVPRERKLELIRVQRGMTAMRNLEMREQLERTMAGGSGRGLHSMHRADNVTAGDAGCDALLARTEARDFALRRRKGNGNGKKLDVCSTCGEKIDPARLWFCPECNQCAECAD